MSGVGPPEPGEGTRARDTRQPRGPRPAGRTRAAVAARYARHRRTTLALATATALLGAGGVLYVTRPQQPPPRPARPRPEVPYPAQVVDMTYLADRPPPADAPPHSFSFAVLLSVASGPPVTVTRVTQPYAGLSLTTEPPAPWPTGAGSAREITVTMRVTKCGEVPWDAGLPFLDVTLRNTRVIQVQSFILGDRYARHLSHAVEVACGNRVR
ncbi:Tat pathway signal sequence domain protein [Streptomyces dangxiongensis]|uniref:Tat pathway signal sequence domain protein n=1 Tax=Streptomyces dangxiongensis TaxID=1442032 RepID=A0A3G2JHT8_9ACTN|nr:Tat pathway signal sequence domain protein [Streptomyces dangxiongensis]AYN41864.1 Tat pathway signal sequence domain protein [Streptomyces dangxiongensis]